MNYKEGDVPDDIQHILDTTHFSDAYMDKVERDLMDDGDIRRYFPNTKIITYPELKKVGRIEQLLPYDKSYFILLFLDSPNSGHWTLCCRHNGAIEFFCSYGSKPSTPLNWNKKINVSLGIDAPYLDILLSKTPLGVWYNPVKYQNDKDLAISTCGRHCCFRIMCLLEYNFGLLEYHGLMTTLKEKERQNYDEIVSELFPQM